MSVAVLLNWTLVAWCLRLSESQWIIKANDLENSIGAVTDYLDCIWMSIITFTTIGYGDFYPKSHLGRLFAISLGVTGAVCTAILVTLMTDKLSMTRRERLLQRVLDKDYRVVFLKFFICVGNDILDQK